MNKRHMLSGLAAMAIAAGAALAFQFGGSTSNENVIAQRLAGSWTLDRAITSQLDASRTVTPPNVLKFTKDDKVLAKLQDQFPRYKSESIYMSGVAFVDQVEHWFVVTNDNGNAHIVLFTPSRTGPATEGHPTNINAIIARDEMKDLLFLGGDFARESAFAYDRAAK